MEPDAAQLLPAPQWAHARLRVELQRREPPGPRLSASLFRIATTGPAWLGGHRTPHIIIQARAELHVVGQPQGPLGKNVFEGGFLGLHNIGVFDCSAPLPYRRPPGAGGRHGAAWPSWSGDLLDKFAVELVRGHDRTYESHGDSSSSSTSPHRRRN